ncbi:hypothetical protein H310_12943 [Aphanomyces invadans]|uniref:Chorein N-terminal domain-containing protein n=1 Tax=Aphanomyces invadans TaxID=157072 RepID=A0A024TH97_9STRA|nr:hypothetical protein H310_12943 [Aphanomyces invadans]ETV92946.1 hypothetical protein H310_12943 [Aphanomyces invadans]|eukprot:XP_008878467.1 hypothetical protein H310_12943 [Aphanomyces invadans]
MFLESIAANLVNKFCRRFIKDFKKENLSLSLSGEVVLTQFELNTDEIKQLQLPVELKSFCVGKLRLRVPLVHLTTQSPEIELSDVNVLLGTPRDPKWDVDSLYVAEQSKIFLMTLLLDLFSSDPSTSPISHHRHINKPPKGNHGQITPSIAALIQNSHITIERIHVRFEDGLAGDTLVDVEATAAPSYALGVTLESLIVYPSTPSTATAIPASDKVLSLKALTVYLKSDSLFEDMAPNDRAAAFRTPFDAPSVPAATKAHLPLLEPLSVDVQVQMTLLPVVQLAFKIHVPIVHINIAPAHYQFLDAFLTHVDRFDRFSLYRRFRPVMATDPLSKVEGKRTNWKDWWRYAIVAVMMDLNDPVRRKPTWRSTLNLVLVGLQYTALRRAVAPYLIRQTTGTADHHFLQYREDFKGNESDSKSPVDRSLTFASAFIPKHVTHFGDGIFAGVYGLSRCFVRHAHGPATKPSATCTADDAAAAATRQAEPVAVDSEVADAKALWHRQLCIDASFRPVIVAKLRALAVRQMDRKEHKAAVSTKLHNTSKGTLTLTLMEGHGIPKPMVLFCKVKVGHKGTPYTGELVHCEPPPRGAGERSSLAVLFAQSYEFRVEGGPNEDFLHVNLFDRWPMFNQFVGKFRIPMAALTSTSHSDQAVVVESADMKAHRMQLHFLSVFVPDAAATTPKAKGAATDAQTTEPTFASSTAMMQAVYPGVFASKPHSTYSWYMDKVQPTLQSLTMEATLAKLDVTFVLPSRGTTAKQPSASSILLGKVASARHDLLAIELRAMQYRLKFVPSHLKHAMVIGRLDMHHAVSDGWERKTTTRFFQAPRHVPADDADDSGSPFASFEQVLDTHQPVKSKISTQDVQVTVDIPVLLRHVMFVVNKVPELTVLSSLFAAPVYQAMMKYTRGGEDDATDDDAAARPPDSAQLPMSTCKDADRTASRSTTSSGMTSPRFLGTWKWTSERSSATAPPPAKLATTPTGKGRDRSTEFHAHIELGALHLALAGAAAQPSMDSPDNGAGGGNPDRNEPGDGPFNVLEVVVPGSALHVVGGKGLPTEIKSGNSTALVKMDRDVPWVLQQLDRIGRVVHRQLKVDARPFYDKPHLASRYKVQRFEYEIHELERQLAMFRVLIRQVVASPSTYHIDPADCASLRLMVRDMQPKVIDATPATISTVQFDAMRMVLQQGMTVLKHNVRQGDPSWRVLWLHERPGNGTDKSNSSAALCLAKRNDRKHAKVLPLASIAAMATDVMTPALARTGLATAIGTYLVLQVVDEVKPVSLEFASAELRNLVATTITRLLPASK